MSTKLHRTSLGAVAATLIVALAGTDGVSAAARNQAQVEAAPAASQFVSIPVVQPLPAVAPENPVQSEAPIAPPIVETARPVSAATLAQLVSAQPRAAELPRELNCLAGAVYFEAKSESLTGQLAVGRVIVARSKSGRFPNSYCGVVFQPSQFSFVRGGGMPGIDKRSRQWRNAVAIAQIAHAGSWRSPVEGALYFHAARVAPRWRLTRMAKVENHVFYR